MTRAYSGIARYSWFAYSAFVIGCLTLAAQAFAQTPQKTTTTPTTPAKTTVKPKPPVKVVVPPTVVKATAKVVSGGTSNPAPAPSTPSGGATSQPSVSTASNANLPAAPASSTPLSSSSPSPGSSFLGSSSAGNAGLGSSYASPASSGSGSTSGGSSAGTGGASGGGVPNYASGLGTFTGYGYTMTAYPCFRNGTRVFCDFDLTNQNSTGTNVGAFAALVLVDNGGKMTGRHNAFFLFTDGTQSPSAYINAGSQIRYIMEFDDINPSVTSAMLVNGGQNVQGVPITPMDPNTPAGSIPARAGAATQGQSGATGVSNAATQGQSAAQGAMAQGQNAANSVTGTVNQAQSTAQSAANQVNQTTNNISNQAKSTKKWWQQVTSSIPQSH
jgi:hypothetical protein